MNDNNRSPQTSLSELGEFGLIRHLTSDIVLKHKSSVKGIGDDAALLDYPDKLMVLTTDLLVEGIHFNLVYTPLKHLGYKSVIVNLSDIYAMNAIPRQITVCIAISSRFTLEDIEELYSGIRLACDKYEVDLVGGDTSSSLTGLMISVTAVGEAEKNETVLRSTAGINDLVCVSGNLGAAYMGLQLLEREKEVFMNSNDIQPVLTGWEYILGRQLKPEARRDIIRKFKELGMKPTAMIDISDGLSSEILHICNGSNTGCRLIEEKIPVAAQTREMAAEFNIDPLICALNGGEDYELLFTVAQSDYDKLQSIPDISIIGFITAPEEGVKLLTSAGQLVTITAQGWKSL
ncbi:MAG: thiamine-phosphate kinase [Bacteroidia bacterium]|nr:thiamine-phosphate kinase [Bacteroidia bacterium]